MSGTTKKKMKSLTSIFMILTMVFTLFGGIAVAPIKVHAEGIVGTVVKVGDTIDFGDAYVAWHNSNPSYIKTFSSVTLYSIKWKDSGNLWRMVNDESLQDFFVTPNSTDPSITPVGFKVSGGTGTELNPYTIEAAYGDYTVTYDANGADDGSLPTEKTISYCSGETVKVLGNTGNLKKINYNFGGWNTKADGTGTSYSEGDSFNISQNVVLYAKWTDKPSLVGEIVKLGDTIDFDGAYVLSNDSSSASQAVFHFPSFNLTGINWVENDGQWEFKTSGLSIRVSGTNNSSASGFKVAGGKGTESNPYTFEVVYEESKHTHTLVKTDEVSETCTEDGHRAYWTCTECGKLFSDSNGNFEISEPIVIPATGHDWSEWEVTKPATENEDGIETRICKNDASHVENRGINKFSHVHTLVKTDRVSPTCTEDGCEAYWTCTECNKLFSDSNGKNEISNPMIIHATGHDWGEWIVTKPATETEDGVETRVCKNDASHVETRTITKSSGSGNNENTEWASDFTGLADVGGTWYYVENGVWISDKYGFIEYKGYLFIVANGVLAKVNGLVMDPNSDKWYFCAEGQVVKHTGLVMYNEEWFYVENGVLDTSLNALVAYNGGLFYVAAGRILRDVSGLVMDPNSPDWYFVALGEAQVQYTGLVMYDNVWFYVAKGKLAVEYTGEAEYDGQVFQVENGMVK